MASLRDTLSNLVEQYKQSDVPAAYLLRGDAKGLWKDLNTPKPVDTAQDMTNLALGIVGSINPVGKTAQELAHAIAQKNAVEMLGLPKGNTAMDRAKAMGYTTPAYHGTVSDDVKQLRDLFYSAKNPKMASEYANPDYIGGGLLPTDSPNVIPTLNKLGSNKKLNRWSQYENQFSLDENPHYWMDEGYTSATFAEPRRAKDAVYLNYYPQDVRSRFAAFDPARANEPDLLAGAMALPIATDKEKRNKIIDLLKNK